MEAPDSKMSNQHCHHGKAISRPCEACNKVYGVQVRLSREHAAMRELLTEAFGVIANAKDLGGAMAANDAFRARKPQEAVDAWADKTRTLLASIGKE